MFETGRAQIAIYVGIAAVLLLVGFNSIRGESGSGSQIQSGEASTEGSPEFTVSAKETRLVVDVSGGVRRPGVYRLAEGSRVIDAIELAGGALPRSEPGLINRAAKLADGQQVVVPMAATAGTGMNAGAPVPAGTAGTAAVDPGPVSLGTATPEQLEEIEGIGPVTAAAIIEFRDSQGGLSSIDELDSVTGIGPVTMEALRAGLVP